MLSGGIGVVKCFIIPPSFFEMYLLSCRFEKISLRSFVMKYIRLSIFILAIWGMASSCEKVKDLEFVRVAGFKVGNLGFSKSVVEMTLSYYNPNSFKLKLKDANFDLFFDD